MAPETEETKLQREVRENYEKKKIELQKQGELIPAYKHSEKGVSDLARLDRGGNLIIKHGKKHKISYIDNIERKPLAQVNYVESYKKYNAEELV